MIMQLYDLFGFFGVLIISDQFQPKEEIRFCDLKKHWKELSRDEISLNTQLELLNLAYKKKQFKE